MTHQSHPKPERRLIKGEVFVWGKIQSVPNSTRVGLICSGVTFRKTTNCSQDTWFVKRHPKVLNLSWVAMGCPDSSLHSQHHSISGSLWPLCAVRFEWHWCLWAHDLPISSMGEAWRLMHLELFRYGKDIENKYTYNSVYIVYTTWYYMIYIIKGSLVRKLRRYGRMSRGSLVIMFMSHHVSHIIMPTTSSCEPLATTWDVQQLGSVWIHGWKHSRARNPVFFWVKCLLGSLK